jgi:hypothetical protein
VRRAQSIALLSSSTARDLRVWTATLVPAAAAALGLFGGAWLVDPMLAAESRSLALLAACVLVPTLFVIDDRPVVGRWLAPLLAVVAGWSLPAPERGAVVVALLVVALFAALVRIESSRLEHLLAAAIALQVLLRSDLLLAPLGAVLVPWLVLPALAALALAQLERDARGRGLLAGAVVVSLAGAITPPACAALLAVAAGLAAKHRRVGRAGLASGGILFAAVGAAGVAAGWWDSAQLVLFVVGAAIAATLGAGERHPSSQSAQARPELQAWGRWWGALVLVAAAVLALLAPPRPWSAVVRELSWLLLLLPLLGSSAARAARLPAPERRALFAAIALAVVALRALPPSTALPIALVLATLALPTRMLVPSGVYSAVLLAGSVLAGAYPWLREEPLPAALGAFDLAPGWPTALTAAIFAALWTAVPSLRRAVVGILVGLLVLHLWLLGPWQTLHRWPPLTLSTSTPEWRLEGLEGAAVELQIDSALANSASLAPGSEVAEVRLERAWGELEARFALRVGEETGEWAAARADLAHVAAPEPWICVVDPSGHFFARRYRARLPLERPAAAERLVVRRAADLPPEVVLTLFQVTRRSGRDRAPTLGAEERP